MTAPVSPNFAFIEDIAARIDMPRDGTLSLTVFQDEHVKAVLFAFAAGQELSEHTAGTAAIIHVLDGDFEVELDGQRFDARGGTWVHMRPRTRHALRARTDSRMLLLLLRDARSS